MLTFYLWIHATYKNTRGEARKERGEARKGGGEERKERGEERKGNGASVVREYLYLNFDAWHQVLKLVDKVILDFLITSVGI